MINKSMPGNQMYCRGQSITFPIWGGCYTVCDIKDPTPIVCLCVCTVSFLRCGSNNYALCITDVILSCNASCLVNVDCTAIIISLLLPHLFRVHKPASNTIIYNIILRMSSFIVLQYCNVSFATFSLFPSSQTCMQHNII